MCDIDNKDCVEDGGNNEVNICKYNKNNFAFF